MKIKPLVLLFSLVAITGCAELKTDLQYRKPTAVNPAYEGEVNGVRFTIDPIFDETRAKEIFDYSPKKLQILPVHFGIENHSNTSFLIQKKYFLLARNIGKNLDPAKESIRYQTETEGRLGEFKVKLGDRALAWITPFGMNEVKDYSAEINHNFSREELRDTTLRPGQIAGGCVYFKLPAGQAVDKYLLLVAITELQTQQKHQIEFNITNDNR